MSVTTFAKIIGIAYLAAALLGFIPAALTPPEADDPALKVHALHGHLLGLFPVNILHTLVHLGIGAWGLLAARDAVKARTFSRVLAVFYGLLAIFGLIPGLQTLFGLVPLHDHDVWLHALTALPAAYFGFMARDDGGPARTRT